MPAPRTILAVSLLGALSCAASGPKEVVEPGIQVQCPTGSVNGGQTIITMDCNTVVRFDDNAFRASISAADAFAAGLQSAPEVLREIDSATSDAQIQFTQSCRFYNSCQMSSGDFQRELVATQAHFRLLREKVMLLKASGGNPAVLRDAVQQTVVALVPQEKRLAHQLTVEVAYNARESSTGAFRDIRDGDTLRTGEQVAIGVSVSQDAYLYLFQYHANGTADVLFPDTRIAIGNPLRAGQTVRLPPNGQVYTVDSNDVGVETVYIVASQRQLTDLGSALSRANGGRPASEAGVKAAMTDLIEEGNPLCEGNLRGLTLTDDPCGSMTRGLQLTPEPTGVANGSTSAMRVAAGAGDDVVAHAFRFNHVP